MPVIPRSRKRPLQVGALPPPAASDVSKENVCADTYCRTSLEPNGKQNTKDAEKTKTETWRASPVGGSLSGPVASLELLLQAGNLLVERDDLFRQRLYLVLERLDIRPHARVALRKHVSAVAAGRLRPA